jgi:antitoxin (DNA-binding transcriptional repressor) of toxin-antitoxin stability system
MIVTATDLANDSKGIVDRVLRRGETADVRRHGKSVAEIRPKVGVSRAEFLRIMREVKWSKAESRELKSVIKSTAKVFGHAGSH